MIKKIFNSIHTRLLITFLIFAYLIDYNNLGIYYLIVTEANYLYFALSILVILFDEFLGAIRTVKISHFFSFNLPIKLSIYGHFVSLWFHNFLPTSIGGDIFKLSYFNEKLSMKKSILIVLFGRFIGLVMSLLIIFLSIPFLLSITDTLQKFFKYYLFFIFFCIAIIIITFQIIKKGKWQVINDWISVVTKFNFKKINSIILLTIIIYVTGVFKYYFIIMALGLDINLIYACIIIPIIFILSMLIPITIGGWGIREMISITMLSVISIDKDTSVIISILYGIMLLASGIPGFLIYLFRNNIDILLKKINYRYEKN